MALKREIGMAMSNAIPVTSIVPIMMAARPKLPASGFQVGENKISIKELVSRTNEDLKRSSMIIKKNNAELKSIASSISFVPIVSRHFLRFILSERPSFSEAYIDMNY